MFVVGAFRWYHPFRSSALRVSQFAPEFVVCATSQVEPKAVICSGRCTLSAAFASECRIVFTSWMRFENTNILAGALFLPRSDQEEQPPLFRRCTFSAAIFRRSTISTSTVSQVHYGFGSASSSSLHLHVTLYLEWCDKIKLSNLLQVHYFCRDSIKKNNLHFFGVVLFNADTPSDAE